MATTETFGGPCPRCGYDRCYIRYGTGTWYQYIACPECLFAFGQHNDAMPTESGITGGTEVWGRLLSQSYVDGIEHVREMSEEADAEIIEDNTVFEFDEDDEVLLEACVASEQTLELIAEQL